MIGPEEAKLQKLKEKDIATVIKRLMSGGKIGFDCSSLQDKELSKYFEECKKKTEGIEVKAVLKSVWSNSGYYVPKQGQGAGGKTQTKASYPDGKKLNNMDEIEKTKVIEEECEQSSGAFWDTSIKIRQELCKRLVIPGFGDIVKDKRLCLVEVKDFKYLLQSQTYLKIFDYPTGHNKNTFGTKCSNYGI